MMAEFNFEELSNERLPFSLEAEQAVLGSVLIDPDSLLLVADTLKPMHFYVPQHKAIFETLKNMFEVNMTIDFVTLLERLKKGNIYDEAGGKAYLTQLAQSVPTSANIAMYAGIIREKYTIRALISTSRDIIDKASSDDADSNILLSEAEKLIYDIRQDKDDAGLRHISDVMENETFFRLTKLNNPETRSDYVGIPSGISAVDKITTGLNKSDLIIVGARPGMGKTSFCLNIARNVAVNQNKTVCFFSLEMSRDQLAQRMLSNEASIKSEKLRTGELTKEEWVNLSIASEKLSTAPIYFDETSNITVNDIKARVQRMNGACDLVIIDYLSLIASSGKKENRVQEVSEITRNLKIMAKELKIPIICCAQLNRAGTESKGSTHIPGLSDLRESGSIEQDADIVLFLHREAYYAAKDGKEADENKAQCIVAKNRHGETGTVDLHWDGQFTRFATQDVFH